MFWFANTCSLLLAKYGCVVEVELTDDVQAGSLGKGEELGEKKKNSSAENRVLSPRQTPQQIVADSQQVVLAGSEKQRLSPRRNALNVHFSIFWKLKTTGEKLNLFYGFEEPLAVRQGQNVKHIGQNHDRRLVTIVQNIKMISPQHILLNGVQATGCP